MARAAVADGSHLQPEWNRSRTSAHQGAALATIAEGFAEQLANGPNAWWGLHAAMQYPVAERLRLVAQPTLLGSRDGRAGRLARDLMPKALLWSRRRFSAAICLSPPRPR